MLKNISLPNFIVIFYYVSKKYFVKKLAKVNLSNFHILSRVLFVFLKEKTRLFIFLKIFHLHYLFYLLYLLLFYNIE